MINETTDLIFHFEGNEQEVGAVKLGRLIASLEKLIVRAGEHAGARSATFFHVAAPLRGSLKFCFRISVEGEVRLPSKVPRRALSSARARPSPMEAVAAIAGVGALLAALFAPDGIYDVFHHGARPNKDLRAALVPEGGGAAGNAKPKREELEKCLGEVAAAASKCGAAKIEIQLPDFAPVQLHPILPDGPLGKTSSFSGPWKIIISTPMGAREMRMNILQAGSSFSANVVSEMGNQEIDGTIEGDTVRWSVDITNPMPMKMEFEAKISGNFMKGQVKLGMFGNAGLTGERLFGERV